MVVASPAACGPQIDESHWGSIASPAPPTPASSPGQCRMSRDPLLSVARRVRCQGTTAPPSETLTPTDGLLRSATSAGRPTQLLRGDRRVLSEKKNKGRHVSVQERRSRPRTQRSAIPTAVLPGQECARGRHTHTPSGRHPLVRSAAEKRRESTPSKVKQRRYWSLSKNLRRLLLVGHGAGAGGDQSPTAYKRGCVGLNSMLRDDRPCRDFATTCYDTSLSIQTRPLLPLRFRSTRVHATQASVCWRAQSTVDSLFFIDVPTNPGPRSFHAWPVR